MSNNEWKLVEQAKNGDVHAFARLYEKYYKELYRFALCTVKQQQEAEDIVSSAVLKAYEKVGSLRKNDSFKSWIFQITANECRRSFRKRSEYLADHPQEEPAAAEDGYLTPELEQMLAGLADRERLVLTLGVFGGYNSREIAHILRSREGTVRSIKSRALAKLKSWM